MRIRRATTRPFAVNLVLAFEQRERLAALLEEDVPVITFSFGLAPELLAAARDAGRWTLVQVGSTAEAVAAAEAGADAVILQGVEAGGHVGGRTGLLALVREARRDVGVPLVAAGGIADVDGARAARVAGADAVAMGTRFLATPESGAHPVYVERLLAARAEDTVLLDDVFDVGWRQAPHRVLRNATVERWEAAGRPASGQRPGEGEPIARRGERELVRYGDDPPTIGDEGDVAALALYCGQGVGLIDRVEPAADIVRRVGAAFG